MPEMEGNGMADMPEDAEGGNEQNGYTGKTNGPGRPEGLMVTSGKLRTNRSCEESVGMCMDITLTSCLYVGHLLCKEPGELIYAPVSQPLEYDWNQLLLLGAQPAVIGPEATPSKGSTGKCWQANDFKDSASINSHRSEAQRARRQRELAAMIQSQLLMPRSKSQNRRSEAQRFRRRMEEAERRLDATPNCDSTEALDRILDLNIDNWCRLLNYDVGYTHCPVRDPQSGSIKLLRVGVVHALSAYPATLPATPDVSPHLFFKQGTYALPDALDVEVIVGSTSTDMGRSFSASMIGLSHRGTPGGLPGDPEQGLIVKCFRNITSSCAANEQHGFMLVTIYIKDVLHEGSVESMGRTPIKDLAPFGPIRLPTWAARATARFQEDSGIFLFKVKCHGGKLVLWSA
ncbi:hypothetical protein B0H11DRAFT_1941916 [Mycena galericulata]|nr:hypothetical protein B0H11DRAFT_1941916 [Mycena galericulata]